MRTTKKKLNVALLVVAAFLCGCPKASGQTTAVSGQVLDQNGNPYANGFWQANLYTAGVTPGSPITFQGSTSFQQAFQGQMDGFGNFSISLPDNNVINPVGQTQWKFQFCQVYAGPAPPCGTLIITITGASMNITTQIKSVPMPPVPQGGGANLLPLNNAWTGTNLFSALLTASGGITIPPVGAALGDVALQGPSGNSVLYVTPGGSDLNNGLSAGAGMATWYHAACSLPGGNCATQIAGNGTIYMYQGSAWNPTATCGAWLMGSNDPNFATPPACWLKQSSGSFGIITTIGIPAESYGPNGQMGVAGISGGGLNHSQPAIWLSSTVTTKFKNIAVGVVGAGVYRGIVVGECSNGTRTGTCAASAFTFDNFNAVDNLGVAGAGPSIDITGASFWGHLYHVRAQGNDTGNSPTSNAAAAILIDGAGNGGNGLIQMYDINTAQGGIKAIPGTNQNEFNIRDLTIEGAGSEPAVEIASVGGADVTRATIDSVEVADSLGSGAAVENDNATGNGIFVTHELGGVVGPMVLSAPDPFSTRNQGPTPLQEGESGFFEGWVYGKRDDAQRRGGLASVRFSNSVVGSGCASWNVFNLTLTCAQADVYGGTSAGVSSGEGSGASIRFTSGTSGVQSVNLSVGETIIGGFFSRSTTANGYAGNPLTAGFVAVQGTGFTLSGGCDGDSVAGDGQYTWNRCFYTVTAIGTNPTTFEFGANADSTHHVAVSVPVLNLIAPNTVSNNELYAYYNSFRPYDSSCTVGNACSLNQPVQIPSLTAGDCVQAGTGGVLTSTAGACGAGSGAFTGGLGSSYQDATEIAAPANPASGNDRLFLNSTTHLLDCHTSAGASCIPTGTASLPTTAVGFGVAGALSGDATNFFYTTATHALTITGPFTASSMTLTNQFSLTLGDGTANRGFVRAKSGGSSTTPGYLELDSAADGGISSFIFACGNNGGVCGGASAPAADSNAQFAQQFPQISPATNVGTALSAQTVVTSVTATGTLIVEVTPVISLAGGCTGGTATVIPSVSFTAPGGAGGNVTMPTLNINSTNDTVDFGSAAGGPPVTIVVKAGTAVTYTTTSTSTLSGCTVTPQYTVYARAQ
ncbi:MAG TPA: hypothetical protein VGT24_01495 [Candidatus Acidoferrales bacterium]|nr:hypothetical protein [Candidatus Acidoferrales bacterium]